MLKESNVFHDRPICLLTYLSDSPSPTPTTQHESEQLMQQKKWFEKWKTNIEDYSTTKYWVVVWGMKKMVGYL